MYPSCASFPISYFSGWLRSRSHDSRNISTPRGHLHHDAALATEKDLLDTERLPALMPEGSWDSHMHIIDPVKYPLAEDAKYKSSKHLLSDAMTFEDGLGMANIVLVQPSIYGYDNSCLLDALRESGPSKARGVVAFDPRTIDKKTLQEWHDLGVRGVRLNFQSIGKEVSDLDLETMLYQHAEIIRPFGWVLQLYIPLAVAKSLEHIVPRLQVKVCLDHYGSPTIPDNADTQEIDPNQLDGFAALLRMLEQGETYVKISAPYRLCKDGHQLTRLTRELLKIREGTRAVFATDWPHTRFTNLDIEPFAKMVLGLCGNDRALITKVFRKNAEDLWDVS